MTRVLHLLEQEYPEKTGGVERYLYFLMRKISSSDPLKSVSQTIKHFQGTAVTFGIRQPYGIKPQTLGHPVAVEQRINKWIRDNSIDVIHVHHTAPFGLNLLYKLAKKYPLIIHWHDYFMLCQRTQLLNYKNQLCAGPSVLKCSLCLQNKKTLGKKILMPFSVQWRMINSHKLMDACSSIVIPQKLIRHKVPKVFRKKCVVIPYQSEAEWEADLGFDQELIITNSMSSNSWCIIGGPNSHKGISDFIYELQNTNFNGQLELFGEGWSHVRDLPDFVKIRGKLLSKKQLINCSHWIIPSKWLETGPLVAIEAHKMGLSIWARQGSISDHMANLYQISFFQNASDITERVKSFQKECKKPCWTSILNSYSSLYAKLTKNLR